MSLKADPYAFTQAVKGAFKIKALFQRHAAIKRVQRLTQQRAEKLQENLKSDDREGLALKEFVAQIKAKRITPEAYFRICDVSYTRSISVDQFKEQLLPLNVRLTNTQLQRLILILDENFTGKITLEEYQDTLEAYQLSGERHFVTSKENRGRYHSMQSKVLEVLTDMMRQKDISSEELFNMIDTDNSGYISIQELKECVQKINPALMLKQAKAIETYFSQFDVNKNGMLERDEFIMCFDRINRVVDRKKEIDQAAQNEFEDDDQIQGDQGFFTDAFDKVKTVFTGKPTEDTQIKHLVQQMETEGMSVKVFHSVCLDFQSNSDRIPKGQFLLMIRNAYPKLAADGINLLISKIMLTPTEISFALMMQLFNKHSTNGNVEADKLLAFVANFMFNLQKQTSTKTDPALVLKESFERFLAQINLHVTELTFANYALLNKTVMKMRQEYSKLIFDSMFHLTANQSALLSEVIERTFYALQNPAGIQALPKNAASLDGKIPGFSKLEPRQQADTAVTQLIKDMKASKIQALQVFNIACEPKAESARNSKLKDSFKKLLTTVNPALVDAACFSFGNDAAMVSKASFVNVFDENFDKTVNKTAVSVKSTTSNSPSAVVPMGKKEADLLIKKLDDALQKQGLSPLAAFKKADVNGTGTILTLKLRPALQAFLPLGDISPAEFKMICIALDVNHNGLIEEQEFIDAFEKARKIKADVPAPVKEPAKVPIQDIQKQGVQKLQAVEEPKNLLLKVILQKAGKSQGYALPYWINQQAALNLNQFTDEVCTKQTILNKVQANTLFEALKQDSQSLYQAALDILFEKLVSSQNSKQTLQSFELIKNMKVGPDGLITIQSALPIFAQIHYKDNQLLDAVNELLKSIGVTQEDLLSLKQLMSAMPQLLKSLLVSVTSIPDDEPPTHVNYLAFATGVWLEKGTTLYANSQFQTCWRDMVNRYFTILYGQLKKFGSNPDQINKQLLAQPFFVQNMNVIKKLSLKKWLQLLDSSSSLSEYRTHKCLLVAKDSRIRLPQMMMTEEATNVFLANLVRDLSQQQPQKQVNFQEPPSQQAKSTGQATNTKVADVVAEIEKQLQGDISKVLLFCVTQTVIPTKQLARQIEAANVKRVVVDQLCQELSPDGQIKETVNVADLVRYVSKSKKFDFKTFLNLFASKVKQPIRESLIQFLQAYDNNGIITKDEFINSFASFEDTQFTKWNMACLFYQLDLEDGQDENVSLETLVRLVCQAKKVPYQPPVNPVLDMQMQQEQKSAQKTAQTNVKQPAKEPAKPSQQPINKQTQAVINFTKALYEKNVSLSQVQSEFDLEPNINDLVVTNQNVLKFCFALYRLQKKIVAEDTLLSMMNKITTFRENQSGQNEQAVSKLIFNQINELIKTIPEDQDTNVLIMRMSLLQLQENDQCILDLFELMLASTLFIDREHFNILGADEEYLNEFVYMPSNIPGNESRFNEFKEEALQRLQISLKLAEKVVDAAAESKALGGVLDITAQNENKEYYEWDKLRFKQIAQNLKQQFESSALKKQQFIDTFKKSENRLTYYELSFLIKKTISIEVEEWEYEALMYWFDEFSLAFVQFNDIIDWLKDWQFDFGVAKEQDSEEELHKKINTAPKQYVIQEKDFFRKCKTILNSEVAALAYAEKLYQACEAKQTKWLDVDFGPTSNNFESPQYVQESGKSIYFTGEAPHGFPNLKDIVWKSPEDYLAEGEQQNLHPGFIVGDASSNEVVQGQLGDCWFIGALSVVATKDELVRGGSNIVDIEHSARVDANVANLLSKGVYPPIFHKYRNWGIYVLRFFKNFHWRYVFIDDRIPVYQANMSPVFGSCKNPEELWVPLIEKAYAKLFGCYQALVSGYIDDGVVDMTGFVCEKHVIQDKDGIFTGDPEQFWQFLRDNQLDGSLMGCSVQGGGTETKVIVDGVNCGIIAGHAYALNDVCQIQNKGKQGAKRDFFRLLRVRNPWGRGEWNGKWSDESQEQQQYRQLIQDYIDELDEDERFQLGEDDGTFLINYKEWRSIYNRVFIANDFDSEFNAVRFITAWTAQTSGGCPLQGTPEQFASFAKNPQFKITPVRDCELFISVGQEDGRVKREENKENPYDQFPFTETMTSCLLFVYELPAGKDRIVNYRDDDKYKLKMVKPGVSEISTRLKIMAGKSYIVIPAVKRETETGEFFLSLYFNTPLHQIDIRNITDPKNRYQFISEENERQQKVVPQWKKDLVKNETLQYMIKSQDERSKTVLKARASVHKKAMKHVMAKVKK